MIGLNARLTNINTILYFSPAKICVRICGWVFTCGRHFVINQRPSRQCLKFFAIIFRRIQTLVHLVLLTIALIRVLSMHPEDMIFVLIQIYSHVVHRLHGDKKYFSRLFVCLIDFGSQQRASKWFHSVQDFSTLGRKIVWIYVQGYPS